MKAYQALASALVAEDVDVVFGVMGDGNMHLIGELTEKCGVRFVAARHEAGAVSMADGYARATRRPAVVTVTHGPGLTQTGTPLTAARLARTPIVLIAGDTPKAFRLHSQNIEQQPFVLATAGAWQQARTPETLGEDVQLAFRHVRLGNGPIVLNVGSDLQQADLGEFVPRRSERLVAPAQRRFPDPRRVEAVAELIAGCQRPAIVAGRGAVLSGAREEIVRLADRIGAVLATTLLAKGWFRGHPFDLGIAGGLSDALASEQLVRADLVLAFGAGLNQFTVDQGRLFPNARLVQIDVDHQRVGQVTAVDDAILGDAASTAEALIGALPDGWPMSRYRTPDLAERIRARAPGTYIDFVDDPEGLDPRAVALTLDEALPENRAVVIGIGHYSGYQAIYVGAPDPLAFILPWHLGSVGLGLPVGIGVAVGRPDRTTVVIEGDGGIMMSLPELETAARESIPLLVIVLDDGAYGAEYHLLNMFGLPVRQSLFRNPDFAAAAGALGLEAHNVTSIEQLDSTLHAIGQPSGPVLIRVPISRKVVHHEVFQAIRP